MKYCCSFWLFKLVFNLMLPKGKSKFNEFLAIFWIVGLVIIFRKNGRNFLFNFLIKLMNCVILLYIFSAFFVLSPFVLSIVLTRVTSYVVFSFYFVNYSVVADVPALPRFFLKYHIFRILTFLSFCMLPWQTHILPIKH